MGRGRSSRGPVERFWDRVQKTDSCWIWTGNRNMGHKGGGYGSIFVDGHAVKCHRYAWFLATGSWPKLQILHKCNNPVCVRVHPDHLYEGTSQDNIDDRRRFDGDRRSYMVRWTR